MGAVQTNVILCKAYQISNKATKSIMKAPIQNIISTRQTSINAWWLS
jgi:hypothetical protein